MIVGVDQVLLDLVVEVDGDPDIYERYGIERNTQCLAEARHAPLLDLLLGQHPAQPAADCDGAAAPTTHLPPVRRTPGGLVANSLRAAAWWLRSAGVPEDLRPALKMLGMVGPDAAGARLRQAMEDAGVEALFDVRPGVEGCPDGPSSRTGVCACLVLGKERTMVTELGAGRTMELHGKLEPAWLGWEARAKAMADKVRPALPWVVVLTGFYIQADPEGSKAIVEWCQRPREDGGPQPLLALSVAAQWCCNMPAVQGIGRSADFVFANEPEIVELASALHRSGDIPEAVMDGKEPSEAAITAVAKWKGRGWVIATRGSKSILALRGGGDGQPLVVPVRPLPADEFVDDVGAGDSFMGGFLASAWQRLSTAQAPVSAEALTLADVEACARSGIATSAASLRHVGCQFGEPHAIAV